MPLIFRLPSFTTDLVWYKYGPDDGTYTEQVPITGQVYTPLRNPDDEQGGLLYFVYPKESDLLSDRYDYNTGGAADVVAITFPSEGGRTRGYRVRECIPRWLKFVNEHLMVSLERLSAAEFDAVVGGGGGLLSIETNFEVMTNLFGVGLADWGIVGDSVAEVEIDDTFDQSAPLRLSVPTLHLPTGATIVGLEKTLLYNEDTPIFQDNAAFHLMGFVKLSTNTSSPTFGVGLQLPEAETTTTFGSSSNVAGLGMTAADWNSDDIVMHIVCKQIVPDATPVVCHIQQDIGVKVYYTLP